MVQISNGTLKGNLTERCNVIQHEEIRDIDEAQDKK
jgi:hypothetical protein